MFDIRPLISPGFWFDANPTSLLPSSARALLIFFIFLIILSVVVRVLARRKKKQDRFVFETFRKVANLIAGMAFIGLILLFFTYEELTFFRFRFWFLIWGLGVLVWAGMIVRYVKVRVPELRKEYEARQSRKKKRK